MEVINSGRSCLVAFTVAVIATSIHSQTMPTLPKVLPGKGLAQHPFLYCGEYAYDQDQQSIRMIRGGKEVWRYDIKFNVMREGRKNIQELGDCTRLANGNVAFTTRFGAMEVTAEQTGVCQ